MRKSLFALIACVTGVLTIGGLLAFGASSEPTAAHTTSATAHVVEVPGRTVTKTRTVSKTHVVKVPVTVVETRTVQVAPEIEEDSAPTALNNAMDAGGDFRKGADVDAWANDSDPTGTKHTGCAVVIGDTSFGACPDGYTFTS